jgi:hypothetical protein
MLPSIEKSPWGMQNKISTHLAQERNSAGPMLKALDADSDEAGRLFQGEAGHLFRFHSGQCSEVKPDTLLV